MKTSPPLLSLAALTGLLAFTHDARGAEPPTFSDLPIGHLTTPPQKKVASVSARESVPGLFVVSPAGSGGIPAAHRHVAITADAKAAAALRSGAGFNSTEEIPSGCVSEMGRSPFGGGDDAKAREWDESLSHEAHAYPKSSENPMSGVVAVHSERLVEMNGTMTLESVDAWVDPATRGARLIGKSSLPLKLVRTPVFGLKVYAARDERPDGKRLVQFIIVRPQTASSNGRTSQMWSMRQEGTIAHSSGCGHARVALPADAKSGETATFVATVVLPALDGTPSVAKEAKPGATAEAKDAKPRPVAFLPGVKRGSGTEGENEREVRTRMLQVQVSVSQTSREKEPLVSVSSSWGGREQLDREPLAMP